MSGRIDQEALERDGFVIVNHLVHVEAIQAAIATADSATSDCEQSPTRRGSSFAVRNALIDAPALSQLAGNPALISLVKEILGEQLWLVRAILFDKTAQANWSVPWHQDTTIAVREKADVNGFGPWSVKAGVVHCQPPARVLEHMVTARIHLDACDESNGALRVIRGSHRHGILGNENANILVRTCDSVVCHVQAGGVLFMRPLLLHSSGRMTRLAHRRVLHLEFAGIELPSPLNWADANDNANSTCSARRNQPRAAVLGSSPKTDRETRSPRH